MSVLLRRSTKKLSTKFSFILIKTKTVTQSHSHSFVSISICCTRPNNTELHQSDLFIIHESFLGSSVQLPKQQDTVRYECKVHELAMKGEATPWMIANQKASERIKESHRARFASHEFESFNKGETKHSFA